MVRTSLLMHLGHCRGDCVRGRLWQLTWKPFAQLSQIANNPETPQLNDLFATQQKNPLLTWLPAGDTSLRIRRRTRGAHPLDRQPARQIRNSRERHERRLRRGGTVSVGGRKGRRHPFVLLADSLTRVGGRHRRVQVRVSFSLLQKNIYNDERNKMRLKRTGGKSHPLLPYKKWGLAVLLRFRSTRLFCISLYTS
jgi:hypothetical protein